MINPCKLRSVLTTANREICQNRPNPYDFAKPPQLQQNINTHYIIHCDNEIKHTISHIFTGK